MPDMSELDRKYFIDRSVYNCPFCNRRNVHYRIRETFTFHWTTGKECYGILVECSSCSCISMHLTYSQIAGSNQFGDYRFEDGIDIDSAIFYSVPSSFFVIDERIPGSIRDLVTEAEGCLKMNFLTGASACARKAIYELLANQGIPADQDGKAIGYAERIKSLKGKHTAVAPIYFDVLAGMQGMTSDVLHEQSWPKWDSKRIRLILGTLQAALHEIFVVPAEHDRRAKEISALQEAFNADKPPRPAK